MPSWDQLLQTIPFRDDDVLVIVSIGPNTSRELQSLAARRTVRTEVLEVSNISLWVANTGLRSTPTTAVLDAEARLQLVISSDRADGYEAVRQYFGST